MAGESWQLAPEVVAEVAKARSVERRRTATVFGVCAGLLGLLMLLVVAAFIDGARMDRSAGTVMGVFGAFIAVAVAYAVRAVRESRRMQQVVAATADAKIAWQLTAQQIVASADGAPQPELAFPISLRTREQLTAMPRATAVRS
jgi:hypothetical protein